MSARIPDFFWVVPHTPSLTLDVVEKVRAKLDSRPPSIDRASKSSSIRFTPAMSKASVGTWICPFFYPYSNLSSGIKTNPNSPSQKRQTHTNPFSSFLLSLLTFSHHIRSKHLIATRTLNMKTLQHHRSSCRHNCLHSRQKVLWSSIFLNLFESWAICDGATNYIKKIVAQRLHTLSFPFTTTSTNHKNSANLTILA
jgi:hypothetical protein